MQSSFTPTILKYLLLAIVFTPILYSCNRDDESKIDGFWQLKTIILPDESTIKVDSQFYGFQEKYIFSFTRLIKPDSSIISYGYVDYPDENRIHIIIDPNHTEGNFGTKSHWQSSDATFNINSISSQQMILEKGDTLFILKRY